MEQVLALHRLLQKCAVLQHQGLDLVQEVTVLLLQVAFQLAQQLIHTKREDWLKTKSLKRFIQKHSIKIHLKSHYLTLVGEFSGGDVQLLVLLLEFGELGF